MPTVLGPMLKARALPKFAPTLPLPSLSQDPPLTVSAIGLSSLAPPGPPAVAGASASVHPAPSHKAASSAPRGLTDGHKGLDRGSDWRPGKAMLCSLR